MKKIFLLLAVMLGVCSSNAAVADYELPAGVTVTGFNVNAENESFSKFTVVIDKKYLNCGTFEGMKKADFEFGNGRGTLVLPDGTETTFDLTLTAANKGFTHTFDPAYTTPGDYTLKINLNGATYADSQASPMFQTLPDEGYVIEIPFSIPAPWTMPAGVTVSGFNPNAENESFSKFNVTVGTKYLGAGAMDGWKGSDFGTGNNRGTLVLPDNTEVTFDVSVSGGITLTHTFNPAYTTPGEYMLKINLGGATYADSSKASTGMWQTLPDEGYVLTFPFTVVEPQLVAPEAPEAKYAGLVTFGENIELPQGANFPIVLTAEEDANIVYCFTKAKDPEEFIAYESALTVQGPGNLFYKATRGDLDSEVKKVTFVEVPGTGFEGFEGLKSVFPWPGHYTTAAAVRSSFVFVFEDGATYTARMWNRPVAVLTRPDGAMTGDGDDNATINATGQGNAQSLYVSGPGWEEDGVYTFDFNIVPAGNAFYTLVNNKVNKLSGKFQAIYMIGENPVAPVASIDGVAVTGNYPVPEGKTVSVALSTDVEGAEIYYKWSDAVAAYALEASDEFVKYEGTPLEIASNGTLEYYAKAANGLQSDIQSIVFSVETGINGIDAENAQAKYYDIFGRRVANPENGIYVKIVNGKAQKVLVK